MAQRQAIELSIERAKVDSSAVSIAQMLTAQQFPTTKAAREGKVAEETRVRLEKWWPSPPSPSFPRPLSLSLSLKGHLCVEQCLEPLSDFVV